jgi:NDP-sugar pyrophosphorylase family protein
MSELGALSDLTAAVLAGGPGTRLRRAVPDLPKVLAPVGGRPFLAHVLEELSSRGVRRAVLCTGHGADEVEAAFGDFFDGTQLVYSREDSPLGTGGALRLALPHLGSATVLCLNGDSIVRADLSAFRRWHDERGSEASILLARVEDASRYGRVEVAEDGAIEAFLEKSAGGGRAWVNAGVYLIARERIGEIAPGGEVSLERDVFPAWTASGLHGYRTEARLLDIGTPESYRAAEAFLAAGVGKGGQGP